MEHIEGSYAYNSSVHPVVLSIMHCVHALLMKQRIKPKSE